jgi:hypothetical protein
MFKYAKTPAMDIKNIIGMQRPTTSSFIAHAKKGNGHSTKTSNAEASGGSGPRFEPLRSASQIYLPPFMYIQANQSERSERRRQKMEKRVRPIHSRVLLTNQATT